MANKLYREEDVRAVADAIRAKNESTETYTLSEMPDAIRAIESGGSVSAPLIVNSLVEGSTDLDSSSYKSVTIREGITRIGSNTFRNCTSLTSVTIPNSVTEFGDVAFCDCTSLTSISIPENITRIGRAAFSDCTSLKSVHISSIEKWCNISWGGDSWWGEPSSDSSPCKYGADIYLNGEKLEELTIPSTVTTINPYLFFGWTSITHVSVHGGVTTIDEHAFSKCTSLTSVFISEGVTSIGNSAFAYCSSFTSIAIPDSVTSIGKWAFEGCTSLTSITIPNSVTSIGEGAFAFCDNLAEINYGGTVAEWTALDKNGIIERNNVPVHCTDGDAVASCGGDW